MYIVEINSDLFLKVQAQTLTDRDSFFHFRPTQAKKLIYTYIYIIHINKEKECFNYAALFFFN